MEGMGNAEKERTFFPKWGDTFGPASAHPRRHGSQEHSFARRRDDRCTVVSIQHGLTPRHRTISPSSTAQLECNS